MTQKPINLKGKKFLSSIELHPDLKPGAVKRLLSEVSVEASSLSKRKKILIVVYSD